MSFEKAKVEGVGVDALGYHGAKKERGSADYIMSPSGLRAFGPCPSRWVRGYYPPDTEAKDFGNLLDTVLLTPQFFDSRYSVKPETYKDTGEEKKWNGNAGPCRTWEAEQIGKDTISKRDLKAVKDAVECFNADEILSAFHDASDKQVHVSGQWKDKCGVTVPVQCLIDYVPRLDTEFYKCMGDLKTTRNASPGVFGRWCYSAGYHVQAAFDIDLYCAATGEDRSTWCLLLIENYAPWEVGRRMISQELLDIGRKTYQNQLSRYARCLKSNRWPQYDDHSDAVQGWSLCHAEPWMEFEALSDSLKADQEDAERENETDDVIP
jgi:hypothetical protein